MIRFACKPGKIFTAVITRSLEDVISDLEENILLNDDEQIFFEDKIVESFGGKIKGLQLVDGSDLRIEEYESDWDDKEENDSWIDELDN